MPDIHTDPAVGATGGAHDRRRRGRVGQIGERQELDADHDTTTPTHARRPVAEGGEPSRSLIQTAFVGTESADVGNP